MEPWQSWTIVGVAGAGIYWYYTKQQTNKRQAGRNTPQVEQAQASRRRNDGKIKRNKDKSFSSLEPSTTDVAEVASTSLPSSGTEQIQKSKGMKKEPRGASQISTASSVNEPTRSIDAENVEDGEIDNKEFARQLSGMKTGTPLIKPAQSSQSRKTQKLGQANGISKNNISLGPADKAMSAASSSTGVDADDDLSPSDSPSLPAQTSSGQGDVSDMLASPIRGPSVLKVTEPLQQQRPSQPKASKSVQSLETKKQRQRQQKKEAQKLEREQAEKERRVLLEKQLCTAREAEGRPAKNGVPISKPPASNAWASSTKKLGAAESTSNAILNDNGSLLDTLEDNVQPEAPTSSSSRMNGTSTAASGVWDRDLPSEEEQMRILAEENDDGGWQTVEKPRKREKTGSTIIDEKAAPKGKTSVKEGRSDGDPVVKEYNAGKYTPYAETGHPDDSDWPVA